MQTTLELICQFYFKNSLLTCAERAHKEGKILRSQFESDLNINILFKIFNDGTLATVKRKQKDTELTIFVMMKWTNQH